MGLVQSLMCGVIICFERIVSWLCCAFVLMAILSMIIFLTIYGISLGYHYAQKEIARRALGDSDTGDRTLLRSQQETINEPVVRLVAVNRSQGEQPTDIPGLYETRTITQPLFLDSSPTPLVVLETERPPKEIELTAHEKELARKLIGRFRRARKNKFTNIPTFASWQNDTATSLVTSILLAN
ncbi:uncharacterized protein [Battus philenor]|uniref:uncharacterized protein n=1 Tax=Battus philenor TaxID=42288 RepID=UPI0035CEBB47